MEIRIGTEAETSRWCSVRSASLKAEVEVLCEVGRGLQVGVVRSEVVLDVLQVAVVLQLRHSSVQHLKKKTNTDENAEAYSFGWRDGLLRGDAA